MSLALAGGKTTALLGKGIQARQFRAFPLKRLRSWCNQDGVCSHRRSSKVTFSGGVRNQTNSTYSEGANQNSESYREEHGLYRLLTSSERALLLDQRRLTENTRRVASDVFRRRENSSIKDTDKVLSKLDPSFAEDLGLGASFSIVIAGEFNAGKSTLINALLGTKLLETGALPTTDAITIVTSPVKQEEEEGARRYNSDLPPGVTLHNVPNLPLLEDLTLIDTPGTNSSWLDHTERTLRLLPSADLIIFVTSADRPFSESEKELLQGIQNYRKSIIIVINKMDILDAEGGDHGKNLKQALLDFVVDRSGELLGASPIVIPISSRDALSAKLMEKTADRRRGSGESTNDQRSSVWKRSNFYALESFLRDSLTTKAKLKSKLANPIGVAEAVTKECLGVLESQRQELQTDVATLNVLKSQFAGWKKELVVDLELFRLSISGNVREEGDQCRNLLETLTFWVFHYLVLFDNRAFDKHWDETREQYLLSRQTNLKEELVGQVKDMAECVATRGRAQGQAIIEYLGKRPAVKNQSLLGSVTAASSFEDTRVNLETSLSSALDGFLTPDDERQEKAEIYIALWRIAALSGGLQVGVAGAGVAASLGWLDTIPGITLGVSLAFSSAACYSLGFSSIARSYNDKWTKKARHLDEALVKVCDREIERVSRRILDGVGPYTRFVENELQTLDDLKKRCEGLLTTSSQIRSRINKLD